MFAALANPALMLFFLTHWRYIRQTLCVLQFARSLRATARRGHTFNHTKGYTMKHLLSLVAVVLLGMSYSQFASAQARLIDGSECHVFNDFARYATVTRCDLGRIEPGVGYNWAVPMVSVAPYTHSVYCSLSVADMWGNSRLLVPAHYRIPSDVNFNGNGRNFTGAALFTPIGQWLRSLAFPAACISQA